MRQSKNRVFFMLSIVLVFWGINIVMIKYLTNFFPPLALAAIRIPIATSFLLVAMVRQYGLPRVPREAWLPIGGVALFSIFLHQIFLSWGVAATSGTHSVLIMGLNPLTTVLLASLFANEPLNWQKGSGIILGLCGILLIVSKNGGASSSATWMGDGAIAIAMLVYVIGTLLVKKGTAIVSPLVLTAYSHGLASLGLLVLAAFSTPVWAYDNAFTFWPLVILFLSGWVSTGLCTLLWNTSIHAIGASTCSMILNGTPVLGVFASALFLGEKLEWQHYGALLLVLLGVSVGTGLLHFLKPEVSH